MAPLREELERAIAEAEKIGTGSPGDATFAARAEALGFLETRFFDRLADLDTATIQPDLRTIDARGRSLRDRLEAANAEIVHDLREQITSGALSRETLARALLLHAGSPNRSHGYDALDLLVASVLDNGAPSELSAQLQKEMVAYQPTPARAILSLVERAELNADDVFCDLGSGLGWLVILVALLTGARCRGIEIEPAYVAIAACCAARLNVQRAEFVQGDLRDEPLGGANVYFLYTPLRGALLQQLLARLQIEATARAIRICTLGPCTTDVANISWLHTENRNEVNEAEITVFCSRPR
jgi:hypothetical protein